jgi:hypothetical protein
VLAVHSGLIQQVLSRLSLGPRQGDDRLGMYPLIDPAAPVEADYILAREAFASGTLEVTEVSEAGRVPTVRVRNSGPRAVLLLDGEELLGARQNRVFNVTILVAAGAELDVPVSCVERGRWAWRSRAFVISDCLMDAGGREAKMQEVSASLRGHRERHADQHAVWSRLDAQAAAMGVKSETGAMHDVFEPVPRWLADWLPQAGPLPQQVGAVFEVQGQVRGVELFDATEPFARSLPRLVRSYALDALDALGRRGRRPRLTLPAQDLLRAVAEAREEQYPAVGLGDDLRLSSPAVQGGALAVEGRVLHLSVLAA